MIKKGALTRAVAIGSAVAASLLLMLATSSAASADAMRTLNLSIRCGTGEAYGLQVDTGSGFYAPSGSSYVVGTTKYFTVSIPASAATLQVLPYSCAGQPAGTNGSTALFHPYSITPGTSTINADAFCNDYSFYGVLIFDCAFRSLAYS
jgi:hypothetical protein